MTTIIRPGDRVQLKAKTHTWHATYMPEMCSVSGKFELKDLNEIVCILGSKATRAKLKGTVVGYGAEDDAFNNKRKFVRVEFQWKNFKAGFYCSQKDLKKL